MQSFDLDQFHKDQRRYRNIIAKAADRMFDAGGTTKDFRNDYVNLDRIVRNWEKVARQIPVEMVQCRRKKSPTERYLKLVKEYREYQDQVDSYMVMFSLIYN
jgi:hypothetical protein